MAGGGCKLFSLLAVALFAVVLSCGAAVVGADGTPGDSTFVIEGRVYCDTCRAGFETTATEYIQGAKVRLECKHEDSDEVTHTVEGVTDADGRYQLTAVDDHHNEICEVRLVNSPIPNCSEIKDGRDRARILLTHNAGMSTRTRFANSLGFLKSEPLPICGSVLKQYHLADDDED